MQLYVLIDDNRRIKGYSTPKFPQTDPWVPAEAPDNFSLSDINHWHYDGGRLVPDNVKEDIKDLQSKLEDTKQALSSIVYTQLQTSRDTQATKELLSLLTYTNLQSNSKNA